MSAKGFHSELHIRYEHHHDETSLSAADRELVSEARSVRDKAYAPYSKFKVGAALRLLEVEGVFVGNNQENVAYPSGLCAERVALFHAMATNPDATLESIAIVASSQEFELERPISPCGACRQALLEYEQVSHHPARVIMASDSGEVLIFHSVKDLLPFSFFESRLGDS